MLKEEGDSLFVLLDLMGQQGSRPNGAKGRASGREASATGMAGLAIRAALGAGAFSIPFFPQLGWKTKGKHSRRNGISIGGGAIKV